MNSSLTNRVVLLTPPGAGAIGVVRVVGPDAPSLVNQAFLPVSGGGLSTAQEDRLRYGHFVDGTETIDDVIVSVTTRHRGTEARRHEREWAVDICAHGGVRVIERILQTLERLGARVGERGESIELAWPTGSVIEHEVVEALTRAKTERAVRFLSWQRENLLSELEAVASLCRSDPAAAQLRLSTAADGYRIARTLIEGVTVALIGPPNSGKSTLFNRLIGRPAAVVSPLPGTTRDWVAEAAEMEGVPITLVDTAGQWDSADSLERQAVEAGRRVVERAEVRLLLLDGSQPLSQPSKDLLSSSRSWNGCVTVITKTDAGSAWKPWEGTGDRAAGGTRCNGARHAVSISAQTGAGCDELVSKVLEVLGFLGWVERVPCLFTARQAEAAADVLSVLPRDAAAAEKRLLQSLIGRCDNVTWSGEGL